MSTLHVTRSSAHAGGIGRLGRLGRMAPARRVPALLLILAFALAGCSDDPESAQRKAICQDMVACGAVSSQDQCVRALASLVLPDGCLDAMEEADCSDHLAQDQSTTSYAAACYEPCDGEPQHCEGDRIVTCEAGVEVVMDCARGCDIAHDSTYSGVCGTVAPNGQTSDVPICWCY